MYCLHFILFFCCVFFVLRWSKLKCTGSYRVQSTGVESVCNLDDSSHVCNDDKLRRTLSTINKRPFHIRMDHVWIKNAARFAYNSIVRKLSVVRLSIFSGGKKDYMTYSSARHSNCNLPIIIIVCLAILQPYKLFKYQTFKSPEYILNLEFEILSIDLIPW